MNHFTLAWNHSVEKIRWEEDYRVDGKQLLAVAARVRGTGAGMDIPDDAVWRNGVWEYRPHLPPLDRLRLTRSTFTADYQLCWDGACRSMTELLGPAKEEGEVVEVFACPAGGDDARARTLTQSNSRACGTPEDDEKQRFNAKAQREMKATKDVKREGFSLRLGSQPGFFALNYFFCDLGISFQNGDCR